MDLFKQTTDFATLIFTVTCPSRTNALGNRSLAIKDAIIAGMASSSKHSATPLPNDWAL